MSNPRRLHVIASLCAALWIGAAHALPFARFADRQATVSSVTDGDTVVLQFSRRRERVRLIGIDTPESKHNPRARKQAEQNRSSENSIIQLGKLAAKHTRELLPTGIRVRIEYDVEQRDRYGRLLAYLWLPNGTMVNEEIIRAGYAYPLTIPPNVRYEARLLAGFRESREKRRGLWGIRQ
jgi:micrococcal nuclease